MKTPVTALISFLSVQGQIETGCPTDPLLRSGPYNPPDSSLSWATSRKLQLMLVKDFFQLALIVNNQGLLDAVAATLVDGLTRTVSWYFCHCPTCA